jgi:long-chain acyl-CoA synthetase
MPDMTLSSVLSDRALKFPKKVCIKFDKRKLTFADVDRAVTLTAGGLQALGMNKREGVSILMENCPEYIIAYFAILRAGGIAIPINTFLTAREILHILNDSGSRILIYSQNFLSSIEEIKKENSDLIAVYFHEIQERMMEESDVENSEIAALIYTSGTTGFPKGAMLTHKNLISNAEACRKVMNVSHKDKILLFLPLFHSFSFTVCVILPIYCGFSIVLLSSIKPFSNVIKSIFRDRITFFVAIPAVYNILSKKKLPFFFKFIIKFFVNIKVCVSGAAALPENTLRTFEKRFNIPLLEGYGLTEASPVVSVNPLTKKRKPGSVGIPLPGIEVAVVGDEGEKLSAGHVGELIVRGPNVMEGYFNRSDETSRVLRNGWLYTGDMAKIDEDGYIYIVDRKKDLIIVDGMNIYPREVEDIVLRHPSVEECAMIGIPDGKGSELPTLFIKKKENAMYDENEMRNYLKTFIARFKMPRRIICVDEFPKTATGKIKKAEMRKWNV